MLMRSLWSVELSGNPAKAQGLRSPSKMELESDKPLKPRVDKPFQGNFQGSGNIGPYKSHIGNYIRFL